MWFFECDEPDVLSSSSSSPQCEPLLCVSCERECEWPEPGAVGCGTFQLRLVVGFGTGPCLCAVGAGLGYRRGGRS